MPKLGFSVGAHGRALDDQVLDLVEFSSLKQTIQKSGPWEKGQSQA
jgi:hypothetical protein